jgi:hypothetical protein
VPYSLGLRAARKIILKMGRGTPKVQCTNMKILQTNLGGRCNCMKYKRMGCSVSFASESIEKL